MIEQYFCSIIFNFFSIKGVFFTKINCLGTIRGERIKIIMVIILLVEACSKWEKNMTRKVILYIATSLDGYIADKNGKIDWLTDYGNQDVVSEDQSYQTLLNRIDTVLMGRTTYDQVTNEFMVENNDAYYYDNMSNYVFTNRPAEERENVVFTNESVVDCVRQLKAKIGKDIWLIGGASIITPLIKDNLIDEYQITLIPVMLGKGIRLFEKFDLDEVRTLKLTDTHMVGDMVYLTYK